MAILLFLATCAWWPAARQAGPVAASPIVHVEVASRSALGASGSLEISPDGRWLFLGGTSSPQLIDLRTRRRSSLERVFAPDRAWGLDPQGRFCLVARASDGIEVWQPGVPGTTALQRVTGEALAIGGFAADGSSFLAFVVRDSALPDPERPWGHLRHQVLVSVATADWSPEWELTLGEAEPFMPARPSLLYRDPARRFVLLALRQSLFAIDLASRSAKELPLQGGPGDEGLDWVTGAFLKVQSDELCLVSKLLSRTERRWRVSLESWPSLTVTEESSRDDELTMAKSGWASLGANRQACLALDGSVRATRHDGTVQVEARAGDGWISCPPVKMAASDGISPRFSADGRWLWLSQHLRLDLAYDLSGTGRLDRTAPIESVESHMPFKRAELESVMGQGPMWLRTRESPTGILALEVIDRGTGSRIVSFAGGAAPETIRRAELSRDRTILLTLEQGEQRELRIVARSATAQRVVASLEVGTDSASEMELDPDGQRASLVQAGRIRRFDLQRGIETGSLPGTSLAWSSDGERCFVTRPWNGEDQTTLDMFSGEELHAEDARPLRNWSLPGPSQFDAVHCAGGSILVPCADGNLRLLSDSSFEQLARLDVTVDPAFANISSCADGSLAAVQTARGVTLIDLRRNRVAAFVTAWESGDGVTTDLKPEYVAWTPDGAFCGTRAGLGLVTIWADGRALSTREATHRFLQPHAVFACIGRSSESTLRNLEELRAAWLRQRPEDPSLFSGRPAPTFVHAPPLATQERSVRLEVNAGPGPWRRGRAWVDGVEIRALAATPSENGAWEVEVPLTRGSSLVEVALEATDGSCTPRVATLVECAARPTGRMIRFAGIGVSSYAQLEDVAGADNDVRDLADKLEGNPGYASGVVARTWTNDEVTRNTFRELREFVSEATPEDLVLVLLAGHGKRLGDRGYHYLLGSMDPASPDEGAVALEDIRAALLASPARDRVLLLDTCESGVLDPLASRLDAKRRADSGVRRLVPSDLFPDLRSDGGLHVLAASQAGGRALSTEDGSNGVFTSEVLSALGGGCDLDGDGAISLKELGDAVYAGVVARTSGQQRPTFPSERVESHVEILLLRPRRVATPKGGFGNDPMAGFGEERVRYLRADGSLFSEGDESFELPSGEWTHFHANGTRLSRGSYAIHEDWLGTPKARRTGLWTYWHESGDLAGEVHYAMGAPVGKWTSYWPGGSVHMTGTCGSPPEEQELEEQRGAESDPNADLPLELSDPTPFEAGWLEVMGTAPWTSTAETRFELEDFVLAMTAFDGREPLERAHVRPGRPVLASLSLRERGRREGIWKGFHASGKPACTATYVDGVLAGKLYIWAEDGQVLLERTYEPGPNIFAEKTWWPGGPRRSEIRCEEGLMHGPCRFWERDGELSPESGKYEYGLPVEDL